MMSSLRNFLLLLLSVGLFIAACGKDQSLGKRPLISALSSEKGPAEGPVTGGTALTILGRQFSKDSKVFFGTLASPEVVVQSSSLLIAKSPAVFKAQSVSISITTGGQVVKKESAFRYTPLLAFSSNRSLSGSFEIFTMTVEGDKKKQITNNALGLQPPPGPPQINDAPVFSPDGREILFETNRTNDFEIFMMSREGVQPGNLTNHPATDRSPAFSGDGQQIVFISNRFDATLNPEGDFELFIMDRKGEHLKQMTFNALDDLAPAFSPDGTQIVFVSNQDLFLLSSAGGVPTSLTADAFEDRAPVFSSDGQQVIFASNRSGKFEIHALKLSDKSLLQLTTSQGDVSAPALYFSENQSPLLLYATNKTADSEIFKISCTASSVGFISSCDEASVSNLSLNINTDLSPAPSP